MLDGMFGYDTYDFEARAYDPTISRFTTMDPLAEKYYSISPYAYCNNNPVNAVDPDGKRIIFTIGKQEFLYNFMGLTEVSSGRGVTYPQDSHLARIVNAYNKALYSSDPSIASQVIDLMNSDNTHYIHGNQASKSEVAGRNRNSTVTEDVLKIESGIGIGTETKYDFSEKGRESFKKSVGVENSDFTTVVHELQHQYDYDKGNMKDAVYPSSSKSPQEIRAANNENRARVIERLPLRYGYDKTNIDPEYLKKW